MTEPLPWPNVREPSPIRYHYMEHLPAWLPNGPIPMSLMVHRNPRRSARRRDRGPLWVTRIWLN